ncbi:MAG: FkbM family methyltransferase [Actinomycetota bacterium]
MAADHVRHSHGQRAMFALRRPNMLWRKIRGKDMIEISVGEIAPYLPPDPVILEAGACDGTDTVRFAQRWPGGVIHAFEPVPELYAEAQLGTAHLPGVRLHPLALSSRTDPAIMHVVDPGPGGNRGTSSLLLADSADEAHARDIEVKAVTIADWAHAEGVNRIDFMWLDMEGMELAALKAAGPVFATVKAVCMEVSREERYSGIPSYGEVVAWMSGQGFRVAIDRVTLWFGNILFVRE